MGTTYVNQLSSMAENSNLVIVPDRPNDVSSVLATEVLASLLHEVLGYDNIIIQRYQLYDFPSLNTNSSDVCSMGSQNDGASMKLVETNTVKCGTPIGT